MEKSLKAVNRLSIADTYLSLGQACNALGRLKKTELYTGIALSIYEEINDGQGIMEAKLILANSYLVTGETRKANRLLQNSQALAKSLDLNAARQLQSMGELYEMEGEYEGICW